MEREQIIEELEKRFGIINSIISETKEGERISHSTLFRTSLGKKLGRSIDLIQEFSVKGLFMIFPFDSFIQSLRRLYSSEEYLKEIQKSDGSESALRFIEVIREEILPEMEATRPNQIFTDVDERVFLGTLVTALYALIDGFSKDALSLVIEIQNAPIRILRNFGSPLSFSFREVEMLVRNPHERYRTLALELAKNRSVKDRLRLIKSGTGVWDCIQSAARNAKLSEYESHFADFINLRHEIAHQNPIPKKIQFLDNSLIRDFVQQLREHFRKSMRDMKIPPKFLLETVNVFLDWINERQIPIGIVSQLTTMAAVYPALIDNVLDLMTSG